jgi:hypothetical protein
MHSARDKYSHAFAWYAFAAAIGTFSCDCPICASSVEVRCDQPVIELNHAPLQVIDGNCERMSGVCPATAPADASAVGFAFERMKTLGPCDV